MPGGSCVIRYGLRCEKIKIKNGQCNMDPPKCNPTPK